MGEEPIGESQRDVFISYASEDRQALVEPPATLLVGMGLRVCWDQFELKVGDSLIEKITLGLNCRYCARRRSQMSRYPEPLPSALLSTQPAHRP
jgi:hypothetical protein